MKYSSHGLFVGAALLSGVTFFALESTAGMYRLGDPSSCQVIDPRDNDWWNGTYNSKSTVGNNFIRLACPIIEDESLHTRVGAHLGVTFEQQSTSPSSFFGCKRLELATGTSCSERSGSAPLGIHTTLLNASRLNWTSAQDYPYLYIVLGGFVRNVGFNSIQGYYFAK